MYDSLSGKYVDGKTIEEMNLRVFPEGTVLCAVTGASIGTYAITKTRLITNQTFAGIVCGPNLYNEYLYYYLKLYTRNLINASVGCAQEYITRETLENIEIDLPSIGDQKKTVSLLTSIDAKIIINNKISTELELIARKLYEFWFIQFEFPNEEGNPYKSSGGKMVWNEEVKRDIPDGWVVKKLSKILKKVNRLFDHSVESRTYDLSVIPSNSIVLNDTSSSKKFETNLFSVKKGDLLFGSIRPYLRKAGIAAYDGAVAGTIHCYEVRNEIDYNLALLTLSSESLFKYAINNSKGTKMPVVSSDDLLEFLIPYNEELAKKFNGLSIKNKIIANVHQTNELSSLRDFLLPLLMNGQVTFK